MAVSDITILTHMIIYQQLLIEICQEVAKIGSESHIFNKGVNKFIPVLPIFHNQIGSHSTLVISA